MAGLVFLMLPRIQEQDIRWAAAGAAYLGLSDEQLSALRQSGATTLTDAQGAKLPLLALERALEPSLGPLEWFECLCP